MLHTLQYETNAGPRMIQNNVQTALILEDDSDWDIGLKSQMTEFARGSRWLLETGDNNPASPYGDNWDILWIGHCHSEPNKTDNRRWVIDHDPTVPPKGSRWNFGQPSMTRWEGGENPDSQTRLVYIQQFGYCTSGYAISLRAAKRILWRTSMMPFNLSIDGGMGEMCWKGSFKDFTCVAPFPRLIGRATGPGSNARSSDINWKVDKEVFSDKPQSENVMFSVRQNVKAILNHEMTFKSFFKNPSGDQLTLEQITAARGHPEWVDAEE
jgi:GR25 family glycosyltransferase involved in LPS biosynthesis